MKMTGWWRTLTITDAIIIISDVWKEVSSGCMNEKWQNLCPQHVHDILGFSIEENMSKFCWLLRGWRRWFGGSAWISQSGLVKWWPSQAWKAMRGWGERRNYSNAWPDLQELGLNISLHWPCCQHKQMRILIWDAAQRLLEMCKLPNVTVLGLICKSSD